MKQFKVILVIWLSLHKVLALNNDVEKLFQDYFDWRLKSVPEAASFKGFHEFDSQLNDYSVKAAKEVGLKCKKFEDAASKLLENDDLSAYERQYLLFLLQETEICSKGLKHEGYLFAPISFLDGIEKVLPQNYKTSSFFKQECVEDYRNIITRLKGIPRQIQDLIETLKAGIRAKKTYSNESLSRAKSHFEAIQVEDVEESAFYTPFKKMEEIAQDERKAIQKQAKKIIKQSVLPAFQELDDFIHDEYMKHLRPAPGVWSIPNGTEFYQACLEYHTTVENVTAEKVHQFGLDRTEELKNGVRKVIKELGLNKTFEEFMTHLRTAEEFKVTSKEEGLRQLNTILYDKINGRLEKIFKKEHILPEVYKVDIKVPDNVGALAYYRPPSKNGARNGTFFIGNNTLMNSPNNTFTALTLHEANPGHHFHTVYKTGLKLPLFKKQLPFPRLNSVPSAPPGFTAFLEGWGLYAEYLGHELGVFEDPYQLLGFYSFNLMRSIRLVVDTGIHHFKWSRQKAIDYMLANADFPRDLVENEIDRYITWPGQATAYAMGERAIRELRTKLENEDDAFDLKQFHADILSCQGPMFALEECVRAQKDIQAESGKFKTHENSQATAYYYGNILGSSNFHQSSGLLMSVFGLICLTSQFHWIA